MSSLDLTTTAKVKAYLGITGSDYDDIIDDLVTTVSCEMEIYCNRQFELDDYIEQGVGSGEEHIILPNTPIDMVKYAGAGRTGVIDVQYTGSNLGSVDVQTEKVVLVDNLAETELTISDTNTIADVATAINNETGWTATADNTYSVYPAFALLSRHYMGLENTDSIWIDAPVHQLEMTQERPALYRLCWNIAHGVEYLVVYQGGYAAGSVPTQLEQLATEITANAFRQIGNDATLKGEKIGDYSWTSGSGSSSTAISTAIFAYSDRLNFYAFKAL